MSSPQTLDEAVDWLRKHYQAEPARGLQVRYVVELSGAAGGVIAMAIEDGELRLAKAPEPRPDVRLRLAAEDWFGILGGRENVDLLYLSGRLEIDGDLSLAMKLRSLFRRAPASS